ncbi:MAG TPA: hypothetical protein ENJ06_03865 [Phycisphaeraceae bacterium]|nr:hypothetical protein [Phycisphaeraceae bacterium]
MKQIWSLTSITLLAAGLVACQPQEESTSSNTAAAQQNTTQKERESRFSGGAVRQEEKQAQAVVQDQQQQVQAVVQEQQKQVEHHMADMSHQSVEPAGHHEKTPPDPVQPVADEIDPQTGFAENAFPPTIPDREWHRKAWVTNDCLRCHETGVKNAPIVRHKGMSPLLLKAKCRSCHILIPGDTTVKEIPQEESQFASDAFPPMMPNTENHLNAWTIKDCLMCHERGIGGATVVKHKGLPALYLKVKCRTCHVQVRAIDADE